MRVITPRTNEENDEPFKGVIIVGEMEVEFRMTCGWKEV